MATGSPEDPVIYRGPEGGITAWSMLVRSVWERGQKRGLKGEECGPTECVCPGGKVHRRRGAISSYLRMGASVSAREEHRPPES
ncbi:hypothetical protein FKM82_012546 [Ascaphus truei]